MIIAEYLKICVETFIIHYVIYEYADTHKMLWQILHILCQLTLLYVGSNEPPQHLLFENTSAPTLTYIQLTKFQKYGQT
jgi:hypothetical protein